MRWGILIAAVLIAGCADKPVGSISVCPPIVDYPQEVQDRFADELARLNPNSVIVRYLGDYHALRVVIDAACGLNERKSP